MNLKHATKAHIDPSTSTQTYREYSIFSVYWLYTENARLGFSSNVSSTAWNQRPETHRKRVEPVFCFIAPFKPKSRPFIFLCAINHVAIALYLHIINMKKSRREKMVRYIMPTSARIFIITFKIVVVVASVLSSCSVFAIAHKLYKRQQQCV